MGNIKHWNSEVNKPRVRFDVLIKTNYKIVFYYIAFFLKKK